MICNAARASRPGLAVGILRVLCNGMCTAQRFHMDTKEQRCGVGCLDEPGFALTLQRVPSASPSKRPFVSRPHHSDPFEVASSMEL